MNVCPILIAILPSVSINCVLLARMNEKKKNLNKSKYCRICSTDDEFPQVIMKCNQETRNRTLSIKFKSSFAFHLKKRGPTLIPAVVVAIAAAAAPHPHPLPRYWSAFHNFNLIISVIHTHTHTHQLAHSIHFIHIIFCLVNAAITDDGFCMLSNKIYRPPPSRQNDDCGFFYFQNFCSYSFFSRSAFLCGYLNSLCLFSGGTDHFTGMFTMKNYHLLIKKKEKISNIAKIIAHYI